MFSDNKPKKDAIVCSLCHYGYFNYCKAHKCSGCVQWSEEPMRFAIDDKCEPDTRCKCCTIALGEECPYYKPYE